MVGRKPVRFLFQGSAGFSIPADSKSGQFKVRTACTKTTALKAFRGGMSGVLNLLIFKDAKNAKMGRFYGWRYTAGTRNGWKDLAKSPQFTPSTFLWKASQ